MPTRAPARLDIENARISYDGAPVLDDLTFLVPQGAQVAVVGPNGAGKSTLFKALVGLLPLRSGRILVHGEPLGAHKDCVAYIPQREEVDWRFPVTVADVVMMGRFGRQGFWAAPARPTARPWRTAWNNWAWPTWRSGRSASFRAASSSASSSPAPWPRSRISC